MGSDPQDGLIYFHPWGGPSSPDQAELQDRRPNSTRVDPYFGTNLQLVPCTLELALLLRRENEET